MEKEMGQDVLKGKPRRQRRTFWTWDVEDHPVGGAVSFSSVTVIVILQKGRHPRAKTPRTQQAINK